MDRGVVEYNTAAYGNGYTKRRPVAIVWAAEHFLKITDAIAVERQIKGRSRATKEALIHGDFEQIRELAKRRGWRFL